jgi:hypothetical protein
MTKNMASGHTVCEHQPATLKNYRKKFLIIFVENFPRFKNVFLEKSWLEEDEGQGQN